MDREKFFEMVGEYNNLTVIFYNGDEIPAMTHMDIVSVEDYDEEILIRGNGSDFIMLYGDPELKEEPFDDTEYLFGEGNFHIGIILH